MEAILRSVFPPAVPGGFDLASTLGQWPEGILAAKFPELIAVCQATGGELTLEDVHDTIGKEWKKNKKAKMWRSYGYWSRGPNSKLLLPSGSSGYFAYKDQGNRWQPTALGALVMVGREEMFTQGKLWSKWRAEGEGEAMDEENAPPPWLGAGSGGLTSLVMDGNFHPSLAWY